MRVFEHGSVEWGMKWESCERGELYVGRGVCVSVL